MLVGQIEMSLELAEEAIEIARVVGDRAVESHALNTLGVDVGALGDRERGIAALRESLAIELQRLSSDDLHRAYTNLGDMLDQDGQVEEAFAGVMAEAGQALGDPSGARHFLQFWDDAPRGRARAELLAEVLCELDRRRGGVHPAA